MSGKNYCNDLMVKHEVSWENIKGCYNQAEEGSAAKARTEAALKAREKKQTDALPGAISGQGNQTSQTLNRYHDRNNHNVFTTHLDIADEIERQNK